MTKVKIIVTGAAPDAAEMARGIRFLESKGMGVDAAAARFEAADFLFAGRATDRLARLMAALESTDVVWCARGGYGGNELLPGFVRWLKTGACRAPALVGMSDCTPIQNHVALNASTTSVYGPMPATPYMTALLDARWAWLDALVHNRPAELDGHACDFVSGDEITGDIVGGNLTMLTTLLGTPYDFSYDKRVLFVEDVDEPEYAVCRKFTQLIQAGKLKSIRALVCGAFSFTDGRPSLDISAMLAYLFAPYAFPLVMNFPCGHIDDAVAVPLNRPTRITRARVSVGGIKER